MKINKRQQARIIKDIDERLAKAQSDYERRKESLERLRERAIAGEYP